MYLSELGSSRHFLLRLRLGGLCNSACDRIFGVTQLLNRRLCLMAEGSDSAAISCNSAESLKREEGQIKDSAMAVDGGGSCAAKEAGSVAPCSEKDVSASAAVLERAEALKNEGNVLFKQHQYAEAVAKYSAAIDLVDEAPVDPRETQLHVFLCNRAFAHLRMENFGAAVVVSSVNS